MLPTQNEVLAPSEENLLTLTTCNPRFSAAQRLIIVSELVETPAPPAAPAATEPAPADAELASELLESSVSGEETEKLPAILWGLGTAAVWVATRLLARRWGRVSAYAMGLPVFVVVLFVFFENFARLLPANA